MKLEKTDKEPDQIVNDYKKSLNKLEQTIKKTILRLIELNCSEEDLIITDITVINDGNIKFNLFFNVDKLMSKELYLTPNNIDRFPVCFEKYRIYADKNRGFYMECVITWGM